MHKKCIIGETASDRNSLMVGIDGITTGTLTGKNISQKGEMYPDWPQLQPPAHAACSVCMLDINVTTKFC